MKSKFSYKPIFIVLLISVLISFPACSSKTGSNSSQKDSSNKRRNLQFPVQVQPVSTETVIYSVSAVGSVEAFETVMVTARVAGVVEQVRFSEGRTVNQGDVLVEIEPDRYRLAVESAEASYKKAQASEADAMAALKRREAVVTQNPGLIPGEEIETWRTRVATTRADVEAAKASLNQARLNLSDALVKAPLAGIIQTRSVQTGQYLQPGTVMATLVRRDPLLLRFSVTEADAPRLMLKQKVQFRLINDSTLFSALIQHIAAAADPNTRMVLVTAEIDDPLMKNLRPGTFAEIEIAISSRQMAPVIPQTAVRPSEKGFLAYIVEDGKAVERILKLGLRSADGRVEVLEGIRTGESLVIRGSEALTDGCSVRIERSDKTGNGLLTNSRQ